MDDGLENVTKLTKMHFVIYWWWAIEFISVCCFVWLEMKWETEIHEDKFSTYIFAKLKILTRRDISFETHSHFECKWFVVKESESHFEWISLHRKQVSISLMLMGYGVQLAVVHLVNFIYVNKSNAVRELNTDKFEVQQNRSTTNTPLPSQKYSHL